MAILYFMLGLFLGLFMGRRILQYKLLKDKNLRMYFEKSAKDKTSVEEEI